MVIWEVSYGPEGDFYATKKEAQAAKVWSRGEAHIVRHEIGPGREAMAKWLNHHFGCGKRGPEW